MEGSFANPTMVFLFSCLLGAGLGVFYDVFRIFRLAVPSGKISLLVQDLIFFVIAAVSTFLFFLLQTEGNVRAFVFVGEVLGFVLYYFTIGVMVFHAAKAIIHFIKWVLRQLYRIFLRPFVRLFGFVFRKTSRIFRKIFSNIKKLCKKCKINLQKKRVSLYNQSKQKKQTSKSKKWGKSKQRKEFKKNAKKRRENKDKKKT